MRLLLRLLTRLSLSLSLCLSFGPAQAELQVTEQKEPTSLAGSASDSAEVHEVCVKAAALLSKREFRQALDILDEAIDEHEPSKAEDNSSSPDTSSKYLVPLLLLRGNAYFLFCNYKRAIEDLDRVLSMQAVPEALLQKSLCLARLGQTSESQAIFSQHWQVMAGSPSTALLTAQGLHEWGMQDKAALLLKQLPDSKEKQKLEQLIASNAAPGDRTLTAADQTTTGFTTIIAGKYFVLYGDINQQKAQSYLDLADSIIDYFRSRLGADSGNYPCGLFITRDKFAGRTFLASKMNFPNYVHGVYMARRNALVTYDGAGVGTLIHEIMHKYLDQVKLEYWAEEGIPAAFEKVWGYADNGNTDGGLKLMVLPRNDLPDFIERHLAALTVEQIVTRAKHADPDHEEAQALLGLFLLHEKVLEKYIAVSRTGLKNRQTLAMVLGKPEVEIEALFKKYLSQVLAFKTQIKALPPSQIFESKEDFDKFRQGNIANLQSLVGN